MAVALDRPALYYPYIHIRDENWLKATLLCFSQVRRMMPKGYALRDSPAIRPYRELEAAPGRPLLTEESIEQSSLASPVMEMEQRLLETLQKNEALLHDRFSFDAAFRDFPENPDGFEIHTGKMLIPLAEYLREKNLGWYSRSRERDYGDGWAWLTVHPRLGEALMSLIAIAIARSKGLDVVTGSGTIHHALATLREDEVFDRLLGLPSAPPAPGPAAAAETADDLAQVVLTTGFDLRRLTPVQIAELVREGKDLRKFKNALMEFAQSLPDIPDPEERQARLKAKAEEVFEEWRSYKKSLPAFALDALMDLKDVKAPEAGSGLLSGASLWHVGAGLGIAVGCVLYSGLKVWRKFKEATNSPYRYLSRVEQAGATLMLSPRRAGKKPG